MQLTAAGNLERIGIVRILHAQADICIQLTEQTGTQVAGGDEFTFLAGKRAVIYDEVHGNRRLGNFLERDRIRCVDRADRITDVKLRDAGKCDDGTDRCRGNLNLVQTVKLIQLADLNLVFFIRIRVVDNDNVLVDRKCTTVYLADTDTSDILIVINCTDQHLGRTIFVAFRSRDIIQDRLKERLHILRFISQITNCITALCGSENKRAVQLLIRCIKIEEQLKYFVDDIVRTCLRTVNFVDTYDNWKIQLQCFAQHELCLRHRALKSVYHEDNTVYHFQDTLYFAAEISMAWGVDNIDFCILIKNSCIFGKNCDTALTLEVVGVHDTLCNFLIGTEYTALFEQLVDQRCFTMVYVRYDRYVSDVFSFHIALSLYLLLMIQNYPVQFSTILADYKWKEQKTGFFTKNRSKIRLQRINISIQRQRWGSKNAAGWRKIREEMLRWKKGEQSL